MVYPDQTNSCKQILAPEGVKLRFGSETSYHMVGKNVGQHTLSSFSVFKQVISMNYCLISYG